MGHQAKVHDMTGRSHTVIKGIHRLCLRCQRECKQAEMVEIIQCPKFKSLEAGYDAA